MQEEDHKEITNRKNGYLAIVFGSVENTFIFAKDILNTIFSGIPLTYREKKKPKWYFDIRSNDSERYFLKIHSSDAAEQEITNYLDAWKQIPELRNMNESISQADSRIPHTIEDLAKTTYLPIEHLVEIEALLTEKLQIIFYGPPWNIITVTDDDFKSIEYTPLNQHYKTVLRLCELLVRDSALDEEIGEKTAISFLINMNKLFEEFVGNLLTKKLDSYEVELQRTEHPEKNSKRLVIRLDIMINYNGVPIFLIDTKYQQFLGEAEVSHLEQLSLYSNTTHVKDCALAYVGKSQTAPYRLEEGITIYVVPFDLEAENEEDFEYQCIKFVTEVQHILDSLS